MNQLRLLAFSALTLVATAATAQTSSLVNNSTRGFAGAGDNAMISGFVVNAPAGQLRWVLVRGVGPTLASFGVNAPLADPAIQVTASNGTVIGVNDNVGTAPNLALLNTVTSGAGAFPLTSANDAGLLIGVPAGAYTVQLYTNAAIEARRDRIAAIDSTSAANRPPVWAPDGLSLAQLFPESLDTSTGYRGCFQNEALLPLILKKKPYLPMLEVARKAAMDRARLETIPQMLAAASAGDRTIVGLLCEIFAAAGLRTDFDSSSFVSGLPSVTELPAGWANA